MKTSELTMLTVYVDGGCKGNGTEGAKCYGSFAVDALDKKGQRTRVKVEHFDLPEASTNNQAEYRAMLKAVEYVQGIVEFCGKRQFDIQFKTDSQLVVHQVNGSWKCKDADLRQLRVSVATAVETMAANILWVPREEIEPVLGH